MLILFAVTVLSALTVGELDICDIGLFDGGKHFPITIPDSVDEESEGVLPSKDKPATDALERIEIGITLS